jgi:hypothetical protein
MKEKNMETQNWKNQIAGCFGEVDKLFAGHPLDEERAKKLRSDLKQANLPEDEIIDGFTGWLYRQNISGNHLIEQMAVVKSFLKLTT